MKPNKLKKPLLITVAVITVLALCIGTWAYFADRVKEEVVFQTATFSKDGYTVTRTVPTFPFIAGETVTVPIKESNAKNENITSKIKLSATWISPDPSSKLWGNADSADNLVIMCGDKTLTYTIESDGSISFTLPSHSLSASAKNVNRDLKFLIPASLQATGNIDVDFEEITLGQAPTGFSTVINHAELNASEEMDFVIRVVWDMSETAGAKTVYGYLDPDYTGAAGTYGMVVEGAGAMHDWTNATASKQSAYKDAIARLTIQEGPTTIGDYAFSGFAGITSLSLPESITSIGSNAFNGITISELTVPKKVTSIKSLAFANIPELTEITFNTPDGTGMHFPAAGVSTGAFYVDTYIPTKILGPNEDAQTYDWVTDQRRVVPVIRSYVYTYSNTAVDEYTGGLVAEQTDFHADAYRNTIKTASFADANAYYEASNYAAITAMKAAGTDTYTSGSITYWNVTDPDHVAANPNAAYSVIAALDSTTGTLTIMADGGKVFANEDSSYLFSLFHNLQSIDARKYDTSLTTDMYGWHAYNDPPRPGEGEPDGEMIQIPSYGAKQILGTETWDVSKVVNMGDMFHNAQNVEVLDVSTWDTGSLVYANGLFKGMSKIKALDVSKWDMADVITLEATFVRCNSLTSLPVENWDVSQVQSLHMTFSGIGPCQLDLSRKAVNAGTDQEYIAWNTSNVKDLFQCFMGASVTSLNVTNWDVTSTVDMMRAFSRTTGLKTIDLSSWDISYVGTVEEGGYGGSMDHLFAESSVETVNVTGFNFAACEDIECMFQDCRNLKNIIGEETWTNTGHFMSLGRVFENCESLESLNISSWDLSGLNKNYNGLEYTFSGCKSLKELDIGNWNVSTCGTFEGTFMNCESLKSIDISSWDMSSAHRYYFDDIFNGCKSLTELTFPVYIDFITTGMAANCPRLTTIRFLSPATTLSSRVSAGYTNEYNYGAFYIDPAKADGVTLPVQTTILGPEGSVFSNLAYMYLFADDNRDVGAPTNMLAPGDSWYKGTFSRNNITGITFFDRANDAPAAFDESWDASLTRDESVMAYIVGTELYIVGDGALYANPNSRGAFGSTYAPYQYTSLTSFTNLGKLNTSNVTDMAYMFANSDSITTLDLTSFDTSKVVTMDNMFYYCENLQHLNISSFDTSKCVNMQYMFTGLNKLESITLGAKFSFTGSGSVTNCKLPTPSATNIPGADGKWYSTSGGVYAPADVPNNVADTYSVFDTRIFVDLNYMDSSLPNEEDHVYKGTLPTPPDRVGYEFLGWFVGIPHSTRVDITSFTNPNADYAWTQDANGVWSSGNAGNDSTESKMVSASFTIPANGGFVSFDWRSNGESNFDYLGYDILNVDTGTYLSGKTTPTYKSCLANLKGSASTEFATVTYDLEPGTYQLVFMFGKDSSDAKNEDMGFVKNVYCSDYVTWSYGTAYESYTGEVTSGMTFIAKWNKTSTVVTLVYNDGVTPDTPVAATTSSVLPAPTREGYTFGGWYVAEMMLKQQPISTFTNPNTDYAWTQDASGVWSSGNAGVVSSESKMISSVFMVPAAGGAVSFDWRSNGENNYDYLGFDILNVDTGTYLSGQTTPTYKSCLANLKGNASEEFTHVTYDLPAGTYQIVFMFGKDGSSDSKEDMGFVKNIAMEYMSLQMTSTPVPGTITEDIYVIAKWDALP